jgi:hypothetical protein
VAEVEPHPASWRHVDQLRPHPGNPRRNDGAPVAFVADSIRRFGFPAPIVVAAGEGLVVAGHTRLKAIRVILDAEPGFTLPGAPGAGFVPVVDHPFASAAEAVAYMVADNRTAELAGWDEPALGAILDELGTGGADLVALGWADTDLDTLTNAPPPTPPASTKPPRPAGTKPTKPPATLATTILFGQIVIPLTDAEARDLLARINAYGDTHGTFEGIGDHLARAF